MSADRGNGIIDTAAATVPPLKCFPMLAQGLQKDGRWIAERNAVCKWLLPLLGNTDASLLSPTITTAYLLYFFYENFQYLYEKCLNQIEVVFGKQILKRKKQIITISGSLTPWKSMSRCRDKIDASKTFLHKAKYVVPPVHPSEHVACVLRRYLEVLTSKIKNRN